MEGTNSQWYDAWHDSRNCCINKELLTKNWICISKTLRGVSETAAFPISFCPAEKSSQCSLSVVEERGHRCLLPLRQNSRKSRMPSRLIPLFVLYNHLYKGGCLENHQHTPISVGLQGEGVLDERTRVGWEAVSYRCQICAGQWSLSGPNCSDSLSGPELEP